MAIVTLIYLVSLILDMYSGANDNFTHKVQENLFADGTDRVKLLDQSFLPTISVNLNDEEIDPMELGIFKKEKTPGGKLIPDISELNKYVQF